MRLADALGELLDETADIVRVDEPPDDLDPWLGRARDARSLLSAAEDSQGLQQEGRELNLRRHRDGDSPLRTLRAVWPPVSHLVAAVRTAATHDQPYAYPWPESRDRLAELLRSLAVAVRAAGRDEPVELDRCRALLADIDHRLVDPDGERPAALGLGAMALPARHVLESLDAHVSAGS